jgi:hypothetical protein
VQHYGRVYAALTDLALLIVCPLGRLRHRLMGKVPATPPHFEGDLLRHSALWHGARDNSGRRPRRRMTPARPETTRVRVVIVNFRTGQHVVACLRSLVPEVASLAGQGIGVEVVVVDNSSGDDSVAVVGGAIVREGWAGWAQVVAAPLNGGFSYGNNYAVRPALASTRPPDYFWILNPDTEVRPGALRELLGVPATAPRRGHRRQQLSRSPPANSGRTRSGSLRSAAKSPAPCGWASSAACCKGMS